MAVLSKPIYLFASSVMVVAIAQSINRLANGTIASPRDALVGDVTAKEKRGASYGFMRSMKTIGSVFGAFIGMWLMVRSDDNFKHIFMLAIIPAVIALIILILFVKEPKSALQKNMRAVRFSREKLKELSRPFWKIIFVATLFEFAHFSESLLSWRAFDVGLPQSYIALVMVAMNVGQFLVAYPLGYLSDKFNRRFILLVGFFFMVIANLCMGLGNDRFVVMIGVFFWGAQMSTTLSVFLSMVSDAVDKSLRGTAFGVFYLVTGVSYFFSSGIAGTLWDSFGYEYTFLMSGSLAVLSIVVGYFLLAAKSLNLPQQTSA